MCVRACIVIQDQWALGSVGIDVNMYSGQWVQECLPDGVGMFTPLELMSTPLESAPLPLEISPLETEQPS